MFRLFRALLPHEDDFVRQLCMHSHCVVDGAAAFRHLLTGDDIETHYQELCRHEEAADQVTRDIVQAIHRSFITPFDRSQILELTTALDDTIDLMKEAARRVRYYGVSFTPEMRAMADCARTATQEIRDAMPLLGDIGANVKALNRMQDAVRAAEGEADDLLDAGLKTLFSSDISAGDKLTIEKIYDLIEAVVDRCEDVADVIEGIVVEQV